MDAILVAGSVNDGERMVRVHGERERITCQFPQFRREGCRRKVSRMADRMRSLAGVSTPCLVLHQRRHVVMTEGSRARP
jgi:hypothetical protein